MDPFSTSGLAENVKTGSDTTGFLPDTDIGKSSCGKGKDINELDRQFNPPKIGRSHIIDDPDPTKVREPKIDQRIGEPSFHHKRNADIGEPTTHPRFRNDDLVPKEQI